MLQDARFVDFRPICKAFLSPNGEKELKHGQQGQEKNSTRAVSIP